MYNVCHQQVRAGGLHGSAGLPFFLFPMLTLLVLSAGAARCQIFRVSARSVEVENGCGRQTPGLFAAGVNPPVLGTAKRFRFAATTEDAWSLPELRYSRAMAAVPAGNGNIGLGLEQTGNADYRESGLSLGYGLPLGKATVGLLFNYRTFRAAGYRPVSSGSAMVGFRIPLLPQWLSGISFSVPISLAGPDKVDRPAGDYRLELGFLASEQVSVFAAWIKTEGLPAAAEIGIDYAFAAHFFFVAGLHGRTGAPFGKTGWSKNGWRLSVYTAFQAPIGFSPGLGFSWEQPDKNTGAKKKTML